MKAVLSYVTTWMRCEDITLTEIKAVTKGNISEIIRKCNSSYMSIHGSQLKKTESKCNYQEMGIKQNGVIQFQVCKMIAF